MQSGEIRTTRDEIRYLHHEGHEAHEGWQEEAGAKPNDARRKTDPESAHRETGNRERTTDHSS